jgi:hypothetical protein
MTTMRVRPAAPEDAGPAWSALTPVLATLPDRFRPADTPGSADVIVVAGQHATWPDTVREAVAAGAPAVVLTAPAVVDPEVVRSLAGFVRGRALVAVDRAFAADRTWLGARAELTADAATATLVDSVLTVPEDGGSVLTAGLLEQLSVVRPLLGALPAPRLLHRGPGHYAVLARAAGPRVTLAGVRSAAGAATLTVDVVGLQRRWGVRFDDTAPGAPTAVAVHDGNGSSVRHPRYETGRRAGWEMLHTAILGGGEVAYSLDDLAADLDLAARMAW